MLILSTKTPSNQPLWKRWVVEFYKTNHLCFYRNSCIWKKTCSQLHSYLLIYHQKKRRILSRLLYVWQPPPHFYAFNQITFCNANKAFDKVRDLDVFFQSLPNNSILHTLEANQFISSLFLPTAWLDPVKFFVVFPCIVLILRLKGRNTW